jgi:pseudomonalisin
MRQRTNEISALVIRSVFCALSVWLALAPAQAQTASFDPLITIRPTDRIVMPIDDSRTVRRFGNVYPKVRAEFDRGRVPPQSRMEHIFLLLRSDPDQLAALDQLNAAQQDPQSPLYHHWLEPTTFGLHFGASEHDLAAVTAWLEGKGLHVEPAPPGRRNLVFSGSAAQVEAAFHTEIHKYLIDGEMHIANATDPEIPEALADVVAGPTPLHDFPPRSLGTPSPRLSVGNENTIAPADFATIYDLSPVYAAGIDGTGESIAILAQSNINIEDIETFMHAYTGCLKCTPIQRDKEPVNLQVLLAGADPGVQCPNGMDGSGCDWSEATLDLERAMSVAPGALVKLIVGPNEDSNCVGSGRCTSISIGDISAPASQLMVAGLYAVEGKLAPIMSVSYQTCESTLLSGAGRGTGGVNNQLNWWSSLWQEASSYGISVFVASGDNGAAGCDANTSNSGTGRAVNGICSPSTVTCVGGTEFDDYTDPYSYWSNGTAGQYIPESVWNSNADALAGNPSASNCFGAPPPPCSEQMGPCDPSGLWSSGGGYSAYWSKPSYQTALTPADGQRDVPDVSLAADGDHDPYLYYINGGVNLVGGTSAAAPSMAGIMALLMQNIGGPKWGNLAPYLYATESFYANTSKQPFHATHCGNNSVPGVAGFSANPVSSTNPSANYNQATGLGSVDVGLLAEAFNGSYKPALTLTFDPASINMALGATAQFTLKVAGSGGFNSPVTICNVTVPPVFNLLSQSASSLPLPGGGDIAFTFTTTAAAFLNNTAVITVSACGQGLTATSYIPVTVSECGYVVTPATVAVSSGTGTVGMAIDAPVGCNWTASANGSWVTILSPTSGSGDGQLVFSYTANPTAVSRLGGVTVQGDVTATLSEIVGTTIDQAAGPGVQFVPITPCRVADTRNATGAFGGPELAAEASREFDVPQSACNIPSSAVAYSLNVTVVPDGPLGYLSMWPSGQPQPVVSTLNSDGRVKANAAIVPAGTNGGVSVFVTNSSQVVLDIDGYFAPAGTASALAFYPVTPCRVVDTRNAAGSLGGPSLAAGASRSFPMQSSNCNLPASAMAYSLNVTAIPNGPLGYLSLWPSGQSQPLVSTLNAPTGTVTANAAIVPAGSGGAVSVYVSNASDVVLDVNGYFAAPGQGGLSLYTATPCRVLDTRSGSGVFSGALEVGVGSSACAPASTAQAYVLNATVVPPSPLGYLTLWPHAENQPIVSTLNATDGAVTSNMAIVPTNDGYIEAYSTSADQLILDLSAYFAP